MAPPIITRESDGLRFEPTVQPGMVRCECCLALVEPAQVRGHRCLHLFYQLTEIWPGMDERMSEPTPAERGILDRYQGTNKVLRRFRR